jgi:hypothetical protein
MKNMNNRILFLTVVLVTLLVGCKRDAAPSVYQLPYVSGAQPVVTSITPENAPYALSGVTTLSIIGSNFTSDTSKILVMFDAVRAQILSASPTQIRVKTPSFYKDSVKVKISIIGVDPFSNPVSFNIKPSIVNADGLDFE